MPMILANASHKIRGCDCCTPNHLCELVYCKSRLVNSSICVDTTESNSAIYSWSIPDTRGSYSGACLPEHSVRWVTSPDSRRSITFYAPQTRSYQGYTFTRVYFRAKVVCGGYADFAETGNKAEGLTLELPQAGVDCATDTECKVYLYSIYLAGKCDAPCVGQSGPIVVRATVYIMVDGEVFQIFCPHWNDPADPDSPMRLFYDGLCYDNVCSTPNQHLGIYTGHAVIAWDYPECRAWSSGATCIRQRYNRTEVWLYNTTTQEHDYFGDLPASASLVLPYPICDGIHDRCGVLLRTYLDNDTCAENQGLNNAQCQEECCDG